ncbi:MAG: ABC transporter ATP-binding protein [Desulfuromonadaceae bacterium]|nr:ABC transporter ATP-binding protein [Desulfuromonadaceae bacterium]MDD2847018.1 ABC transporter ATP-binding protein [Desulfuromonadaceae bacterium]MDD4129004.1 ABC transporter ATP-binding protein [Desulfuromonadaceae bacterium]
MNAIEIKGLCKHFPGKRMTKVDALKGLDLTIEAGEVFGFLGPNGAGKSTTIKLVMGLLRPTSGSASIIGMDASLAESRRHVGYLPENPAFYDYLSAEEYIAFVGSQFKIGAALLAQRSEEVLHRLDLWEARKRPMRGYSKGMVQRVGVAQALVHDPEVYILDEPMSGLDPIGRALVKDIILDLKKRGKCVFFSTHITDDVEKVCDRVGVIVKGSLVALDRVENILRSGVEGYIIHLQLPETESLSFAGIEALRRTDSVSEFYVPCSAFNAFMGEVNRTGTKVVLVETKRRDLEDFFLSLVHTGQES